MESLLQRATDFGRSEHGRLTLCAVIAAALTASSIFAVQHATKLSRSEESRLRAVRDASSEHEHLQLSAYGGQIRKKDQISEDIIREQLSRNYIFFGEAGMAKLRRSFVIIVGVGGVGSWATVMLVRSGVGRVRIIDFDQVTLSSLNRHAAATLEDVGSPKVLALKRYLSRVAPWIEVECRNDLFRKEDQDELLEPWRAEDGSIQQPDFVIDAIDNIETKADLLAFCHDKKIPVIASMGAGCKSDPTRILISDISETAEDPLSRATRRHLRLRGIKDGIPTVYSTEKPGPGKAQLKPLDDAQFAAAKEYGILPDFRARILPVLGTMPAMFGLTLTTYVLCALAEYPLEPIRHKSRKSLYEGAFKDLAALNLQIAAHTSQGTRDGGVSTTPSDASSSSAGSSPERLPFTPSDLGFLIDELSNGKSNLPPHFPQKLTVTKWDPTKRMVLSNLVVLTKDEARKHNDTVLLADGRIEDTYSREEVACIERYRARFTELQAWRDD